MDYTIAPDTTAIGSGDAPPASGTPGEFTNGNPTTNTPATILPGYQMNALVREIRNVISFAGITPSRFDVTQLQQAITELINAAIAAAFSGSDIVNSFNTRTGAVTLSATDINNALGYQAASTDNLYDEAVNRTNADTNLQNQITALFSASHDVTGSRALGVVYTNTTGRPMYVFASGFTTVSAGNYTFLVSGQTQSSLAMNANGSEIFVCGLVPAGYQYEAVGVPSNFTLEAWSEVY